MNSCSMSPLSTIPPQPRHRSIRSVSRLLAELAAPASASSLAGRVGLTREQANYHLRALERHGLVELVEERRKGNCVEQVLQATAAAHT